MQKTYTAIVLLMLAISTGASAQWVHANTYIDSSYWRDRSVHGLAVDPEGKIWVQGYFATGSLIRSDRTPVDTVSVRAIRIYNPNGTQASFSPLMVASGPSVQDTFYTKAGVGLRADKDGNMLAAFAYVLFKFDYTDGTALAREIPYADSATLVSPGVTDAGDIITGTVFPAKPIKILDGTTLAVVGNAFDSSIGFARSINVSPDGNDIYHTAYGSSATYLLHSDLGTLGTYELTDTLFPGMATESSAWNPKDGYLYLASGGQVQSTPEYTNRTYYAYDPASGTLKDSMTVWGYYTGAVGNVRPRAIAFTASGDTAYIGGFEMTGGAYGLEMFVRGTSGVQKISQDIPDGYALSQNYPNPFNPTTQIEFTVAKAGMTTLRVYDLLGREVATLVDEHIPAGTFKATFDASSLTSGTYVYEIVSGDVRIVKRMMFVK
jgi:hypothetical protein